MPAENAAPAVAPLLDLEFLRKLERLSVVPQRAFPGRMKGEKRSPKRGTSIEFADYREYTAGDDLRYVCLLYTSPSPRDS